MSMLRSSSWSLGYCSALAASLFVIAVVNAEERPAPIFVNPIEKYLVRSSTNDEIADLHLQVVELEDGVGTTEPEIHEVRLGANGHLVGMAQLEWNDGESVPVPAKVLIVQDREIVDATTADDSGYFQFVGLKPGAYTAACHCDGGSGRLEVQVLPYDRNAAPEEMVLHATLSPVPEWAGDGTVVSEEIISEEIVGGSPLGVCDTCGQSVPLASGCCDGVAKGGFRGGFKGGKGGCCGGGFGWGWLGLGGLAGLAGLAGDDGDPDVVSPFKVVHNP